MIEQLHDYYLNKEEPNKSCLFALRNIILNQDTNITETQKWGMPCFCYKKKIFCYLWIDKKTDEPYILMVEGKYLDHPISFTNSVLVEIAILLNFSLFVAISFVLIFQCNKSKYK